jgi:hypothetical protein
MGETKAPVFVCYPYGAICRCATLRLTARDCTTLQFLGKEIVDGFD